MSAIAGLIHFDGQPVESNDLNVMLAQMEHRGVNGRGV